MATQIWYNSLKVDELKRGCIEIPLYHETYLQEYIVGLQILQLNIAITFVILVVFVRHNKVYHYALKLDTLPP